MSVFDALPPALAAAVGDLGFTTPTEIQAEAIPALLAGSDVIGLAQTGTGKTAAFGLPLLAAVDASRHRTQAVVLTPTRELAGQVAEAIERFAAHLPDLEVVAVYGGAPYVPQRRALSHGAQVVVGTPGRVIDHLERGSFSPDDVRFVVIDEADEMLRMGFADEVDQILSRLPSARQTALFSATMPAAIRGTAQRHLNDPVEISITRSATTVANITQDFAVVPYKHKLAGLTRVLATSDVDAAIVFCKTRAGAEQVGVALAERGINAATISGDVPQAEREKIVERLRSGRLTTLVATDVAARGLDVDKVGLVVNFDLPHDPEAYVHRIGRTGRAGRSGRALTLVTPAERGRLRTIERVTRRELTEVHLPTAAEVTAHRLTSLLARVPERLAKGRLANARETVTSFAANSDIDPLDLLAALAALAVGDEGPQAAEAREEAEIAAAADHRPTPKHRRGAENPVASGGQRRYWVGVGHRHGIGPSAIVGAITGEGGLKGSNLGRIEMHGSFSLVDIDHELSAESLRRISAARVAGKALRMRPDGGSATTRPRSHPRMKGTNREKRQYRA